MEENNSAFVNDDSIYNKKIKSVPKPEPEIGIDNKDSFYQNIMLSLENGGISSHVDMQQIESFSTISQSRDEVYTLLDTMAMDSKVSAILDTMASDATEYNDEGKIVWVESSNGDIAQYVSYLINTLQVDKHIYGWVYSLIKYGDLYLRLYRESEYDNSILFGDKKDKEQLNEEIYINAYKKNDKFVHYLEAVPNPAEVFELTKFGKTQAFIKTELMIEQAQNKNPAQFIGFYRYSFDRGDINVYEPNMFVHALLEDTSNRSPELVEIFRNIDGDDVSGNKKESYEYKVRRGKSILYDKYKVWRLLNLLENSLVLNRLTKSSILRIIGVEVGDMAKEDIRNHLYQIKTMVEQKAALDTGNSMAEYTNPGPIENNIYISTNNGKGAITTTQIGGDVNVRDIADIDYYVNLFYGSFGIPKQYFSQTDDGAGFNGGTSLSIISSRYAKDVKKIQNAILQALTNAINIMLIDKKMTTYVNQFKLRMLPPTTREELDRRENVNAKIGLLRDTMDVLSDIEDPAIKLKIEKAFLSSITSNEEVIQLIQEQIEKLEAQEGEGEEPQNEETPGEEGNFGGFGENEPLDLNRNALGEIGETPSEEGETEISGEEETILPTPNDLGIDMTQNEE